MASKAASVGRSLRSAPEHWLLGKPTCITSTARLPRALDALRCVQFYHLEEKMNLADSLKSACEAIIAVWDRGHIPTQRIDSCIRKLRKLYENYLALKKHSKRQREGDRMK